MKRNFTNNQMDGGITIAMGGRVITVKTVDASNDAEKYRESFKT